MPISRRSVLLAGASAGLLAACGGGDEDLSGLQMMELMRLTMCNELTGQHESR